MGWTVYGTDSRFSYRVDQFGLSVSGEGRFDYRSSLNTDMREIEGLPARWEIHRASEAAEAAAAISTDVRNMKRYLDATFVKTTSKPIGIIKYEPERPRHLGFSAFVPDQYFANIWELLTRCSAKSDMRYWLGFDFIGFMPKRVAEHADVISYDDWLAGRPCLSEGFAFGLAPGAEGQTMRPSMR